MIVVNRSETLRFDLWISGLKLCPDLNGGPEVARIHAPAERPRGSGADLVLWPIGNNGGETSEFAVIQSELERFAAPIPVEGLAPILAFARDARKPHGQLHRHSNQLLRVTTMCHHPPTSFPGGLWCV